MKFAVFAICAGVATAFTAPTMTFAVGKKAPAKKAAPKPVAKKATQPVKAVVKKAAPKPMPAKKVVKAVKKAAPKPKPVVKKVVKAVKKAAPKPKPVVASRVSTLIVKKY